MNVDYQLVYINGFMRSGSTILGVALGRFNQIQYLGEMRNFDDFYAGNTNCSCGQPIWSCTYWNPVAQHVSGCLRGAVHTKGNTGFRHNCLKLISIVLKNRNQFYNIAEKISPSDTDSVKMIHKILNITEKNHRPGFFCDSSHRNLLLALHVALLPERMKVIQLVRDGRDVCASVKKRFGEPVWKTALRWRKFYAYSNRLMKQLGNDRVIRVHYEDLKSLEAPQFKKLAKFLSLTRQGGSRADDNHFVGGSPSVRGKEPVVLNPRSTWKEVLTPSDIKQFELFAGRFNASMGYTL